MTTTAQKNKDLEVKILKQSLRFLSAAKSDERAQMIESILKHNNFSADYINKHLKHFAGSSLSIAELTDLIQSLGRQSNFKQKRQQKSASIATSTSTTSNATDRIPSFIEVQHHTFGDSPISRSASSNPTIIKSASSLTTTIEDKLPSFLITRKHLGL